MLFRSTIVFPVPRYGRGLELLKLFEDKFPEFHLYGDAHFINQTAHLSMAENWLKKQARSFEFHVSLYNSNHDADILRSHSVSLSSSLKGTALRL